MVENVKLTRIEKKSQKTGKTSVINYAKVNDRLKAFREDHPKSSIQTFVKKEGNKYEAFAWIWRDKKEVIELAKSGADVSVIRASADATGSADYTNANDKQRERLETIAVGRALALLGYAVNGEIASSEEMVQFEEYKEQLFREKCDEAIGRLSNAKSIDELAQIWREIARSDPKVVADNQVLTVKNTAKDAFARKIEEAKK